MENKEMKRKFNMASNTTQKIIIKLNEIIEKVNALERVVTAIYKALEDIFTPKEKQ